jgi:hypothetical protein
VNLKPHYFRCSSAILFFYLTVHLSDCSTHLSLQEIQIFPIRITGGSATEKFFHSTSIYGTFSVQRCLLSFTGIFGVFTGLKAQISIPEQVPMFPATLEQ